MEQVNTSVLLIFISVYFLILLGAIIKSRYSKTGKIMPDASEFFLAGRSLSTPVLVATFIGTLFSAYTVVGVPSAVYANGIADWYWLLGASALMIISMVLFAKKYYSLSLKFDTLSPVELIARAYKSKGLGVLMSVIILIFLTPYLAIQLVGMGKLLQSVSGGDIGYLNGVGFIMTTIIVYLIFGGMRAVAYTDFIQAILIFVGIIGTVTLFVFHYFGGVGELISAIQTQRPEQLETFGNKGQYTIPLLLSNAVFVGLLILGQPQTLTRIMMANSYKQINIMIIVTTICMIVGYGGGAILGLGGSVIFPDLAEPNLLPGQILSAMMSISTLGLVVAGMLLLGVIAASMSTADSLLIAIGQLFTRDITRPYIELSHDAQVKVAKLVMVIVLIAAFWLGLNPPPVMIDLASYSFMGTSILVPIVVASCFAAWRCKPAAFIAIVLGEITFITLLMMDIFPLGFHPSFAGLALSLACVCIGRLFYHPKKA